MTSGGVAPASAREWVLLIGIVVALAMISAVFSYLVLLWRAASHGPELVRTNVRGLEVPVILGDALVWGTLAGVGMLAVIELVVGALHSDTVAVAAVVLVMWAAGAWDDRKGDERPRGFKGHLGALRSKAITGGLVKIAAGVVAGVAAAALLPSRGASPAAHVLETIALVALTANLVNLLDRAPGRAGKWALVVAAPLVVFGDLQWVISVGPLVGALAFCLVPDLGERAMLGDAGANPLGAVLGVGLAASLGEPGRLIAIAVLLALNLASERWSFSKAIEASPPLRWFDGLGRRGQVAPK